jgi:hypothetical protein
MTERTGESRLDTAAVPAQAAPLMPRTSARRAAWSAYQDHLHGCSQCTNSVWRCAEGNELWNEYLSW